MREWLGKLSEHEEGATAVEYAIMGALIAAVSAAIVAVLGQQVAGLFARVSF